MQRPRGTKMQSCSAAVAFGHTRQTHNALGDNSHDLQQWHLLLAFPGSKAARVDGMLCSNAELAAYL